MKGLTFLLTILFIASLQSLVQGLSDMECYRCIEGTFGNRQIQCQIQEEVDIGLLEESYGDLMEAEDIFAMANPCLSVAEKVLDFVESENGLFRKDTNELDDDYQSTGLGREDISTIQFQKRPNSDWVIAEIQLKETPDVMSFILTDPELELLNIPYDSSFFVVL